VEEHQRSALRRAVDRLARRLSGPDRKQIEGVVQPELPPVGIGTAFGLGRVRRHIRVVEPVDRQRLELQTVVAAGRTSRVQADRTCGAEFRCQALRIAAE
jgi:hypothetical protein